MSEPDKKPVIFDLEEMEYDRNSGRWRATFIAKPRIANSFKITVSISDSNSGDDDGYPQQTPAELAALRLREQAHLALQSLVEVSARNLRKGDALLPSSSE